MKPVFFLLLFANIVLFLYEITTPSQSSGESKYELDANLQAIQLPGEVDPDELDELGSDPVILSVETPTAVETQQISPVIDNDALLPAEVSDQSTIPEIVAQPGVDAKVESDCFKAGLFKTQASAKKALARLKSQLIRGWVAVVTRQEQEGFWVVYPAAETFEESQANLDMLTSNGMNDLWLFERGPLRGAISLGWFRVEAYAADALKQYRQQGLEVEMKTKSVAVSEYSILIESGQTERQLKQVLDELSVDKVADFRLQRLNSCEALESQTQAKIED